MENDFNGKTSKLWFSNDQFDHQLVYLQFLFLVFIYNFFFSLLVSSHVNRWRCDAVGYNISPVMYEMEKFAALEL